MKACCTKFHYHRLLRDRELKAYDGLTPKLMSSQTCKALDIHKSLALDFPVARSFFRSQYSMPGNLLNSLATMPSLTPCKASAQTHSQQNLRNQHTHCAGAPVHKVNAKAQTAHTQWQT